VENAAGKTGGKAEKNRCEIKLVAQNAVEALFKCVATLKYCNLWVKKTFFIYANNAKRYFK